MLSVVGEGIPLIYNGQEAGSDRRLLFFEKDLIDWRDHELGELYRRLFALKKEHRALWNGAWGAPMVRVTNDAEDVVLSFVRRMPADGRRGEGRGVRSLQLRPGAGHGDPRRRAVRRQVRRRADR